MTITNHRASTNILWHFVFSTICIRSV